jgi:hypothetical protein
MSEKQSVAITTSKMTLAPEETAMGDKPQSLAQPNGHEATQAPVAELVQLLDAHRGEHPIVLSRIIPTPTRFHRGSRTSRSSW